MRNCSFHARPQGLLCSIIVTGNSSGPVDVFWTRSLTTCSIYNGGFAVTDYQGIRLRIRRSTGKACSLVTTCARATSGHVCVGDVIHKLAVSYTHLTLPTSDLV